MSSTVWIGILFAAIIIVPIWMLVLHQSAGKRKLEKEITSLGKGHNIEITEHESFKNKVIGIDREGFKGALAIFNEHGNQVFLADLKQFSRCYVDKELLNSGSKYDNDVVSKITLQFVARTKGTENLVFPVYTDTIDKDLANELMIAQEWADKFNGVIHKFNV
jgi:hypothetical protein